MCEVVKLSQRQITEAVANVAFCMTSSGCSLPVFHHFVVLPANAAVLVLLVLVVVMVAVVLVALLAVLEVQVVWLGRWCWWRCGGVVAWWSVC